MALALQRDRTVAVTIGNIRRISNIDGINLVKLDNTAGKRNALAERLKNAGCSVNTGGTDWLNAGDFTESRTAPIGPEEIKEQDGSHGFEEEEISILKVLYERGETMEYEIAGFTELGRGKVSFWLNELLGEGIINQTTASMSDGENSFMIRSGQVDMLRAIGVMK